MANDSLTGEKEGFFARRLIPFWPGDQKVFRKGGQMQSVFPLDQMCKVIDFDMPWEIC
jgi:hypothetical protein